MKKVVLLLIIFLSSIFLSACKLNNKVCVSSHIEEYYDSTGTALAISTKNYGLMALNGWKEREVCDKWEDKE